MGSLACNLLFYILTTRCFLTSYTIFFVLLIFIILSSFLYISAPFSHTQLLLPRNASISSAVKVRTSSSLPPPLPPPPDPHSLSPDDCDFGLPLTSQLTSSLASQSQPTEYSNIIIVVIIIILLIIIVIVISQLIVVTFSVSHKNAHSS